MSIVDIVNTFIRARGYKSCLLIGGDGEALFFAATCAKKVWVAPDRGCMATVHKTSDEFFASNTEKFDIVLIDGVHMCEQVLHDIHNALDALSPGGVVVIHDCLPPTELIAARERVPGAWCGDVYKAVSWFFSRSDYLCYTIDTDYGVGVVDTAFPAPPSGQFPCDAMQDLTYAMFAERKSDIMHVVQSQDFTGRVLGSSACRRRYGILYRHTGNGGVFSNFVVFCGGVGYCLSHGLVPVIDMKNYDGLYRANPAENPWEYFFEQPCGVSLEDIANGEDAVAIECDRLPRPNYGNVLKPGASADGWRAIVHRFMQIKHDKLRRYVNRRLDVALAAGRVLGVIARGTDYTNLKPRNHAVQPPVERIIDDTKRIMQDHGFDFVYLATEDAHVQRSFEAAIPGDRLIPSLQDKLEAASGVWLCQYPGVMHNVDFGLAYLKAMYDMSRCHGLLAGRTTGLLGVKLLSAGYEYEHYYDLGVYR